MKSEYDAHRHLRNMERSISQRYENGYDPYNSVDRWHCPLPLFFGVDLAEVESRTNAALFKGGKLELVLTLPPELRGLQILQGFTVDDAFEFIPPLGTGPATPEET